MLDVKAEGDIGGTGALGTGRERIIVQRHGQRGIHGRRAATNAG